MKKSIKTFIAGVLAITMMGAVPAVAAENENAGFEQERVVVPEDGKYTITVESNSTMFKVVDCVIDSKDSNMIATVTLSGTGYDLLFVGTASDAAIKVENNDTEDFVKYNLNEGGQYQFEIPLFDLGSPLQVAAHSVKKDLWYDRTLTFLTDTLKKVVEIIKGDANGDGYVTLEDVLIILKHSLGITELKDDYYIAADINNDGSVTLEDTLSSLKIALGIN